MLSIPSEKLEPSVPGWLTADPDCRGKLELSHAETVKEVLVLTRGALATAT